MLLLPLVALLALASTACHLLLLLLLLSFLLAAAAARWTRKPQPLPVCAAGQVQRRCDAVTPCPQTHAFTPTGAFQQAEADVAGRQRLPVGHGASAARGRRCSAARRCLLRCRLAASSRLRSSLVCCQLLQRQLQLRFDST